MTTKRSRVQPSVESERTLAESLLAYEHGRHADRLAAIKRMGARLALLDAFMPAIAAAGIVLNLDEIHDYRVGKTIYLGSGFPDHSRNAKLANVLLACGMRVADRKEYDYGHGDVRLDLVKGRLRVSLSIDGRSKHLLEVPA